MNHVIIPCRNEATVEVRDAIIAWLSVDETLKVWLINDQSDAEYRSQYLALEQELQPRLKVFDSPAPGGAGLALWFGLRSAAREAGDDDWLLTAEADCSVDCGSLAQAVSKHRASDLLFFSRWKKGGKTVGFPPSRKVLSRGASWLHRMRSKSRMGTAGPWDWTLFHRAMKAGFFRRSITADPLSLPRSFAFQSWIVHELLKADPKWVEVPVLYRYRRHGRAKPLRHLKHILAHLKVVFGG